MTKQEQIKILSKICNTASMVSDDEFVYHIIHNGWEHFVSNKK